MTWHMLGSAADRPFSRLDLRAKLAIVGVIMFLALLWENLILSAALALLTLALCIVAGIRPGYLRGLVRVMLLASLLLLVMQGFWNTWVGRTPLWTAPANWWLVGGHLTLTLEGLAYGAMLSLRSLTLILAIPLVIFTTDLTGLVMGLVRLRVSYAVAFVFSATLRFVPLLLGEVQEITEAQRLRGLALERMNLWQRVGVYSRIAVPLILGALTRAQQTDVALAARAFSGSPARTYLHESTVHTVDYIVVVLSLTVALLAIWLRISVGLGRFGM